MRSQKELDLILGFMCNLGKELSKEVILTDENSKESVWFRYVPGINQVPYEAAAI